MPSSERPFMPTTRTGPIMVTNAKSLATKGSRPAAKLPGEVGQAELIKSNSMHQRGEKRHKLSKGGFSGRL